MYNFLSFFVMGGNNVRGFEGYFLISSNTFWCPGSHLKPSSFLKRGSGENTFDLSLRFKMNLLRKLIVPNKDWSFFLLVGDSVFFMGFVLF